MQIGKQTKYVLFMIEIVISNNEESFKYILTNIGLDFKIF